MLTRSGLELVKTDADAVWTELVVVERGTGVRWVWKRKGGDLEKTGDSFKQHGKEWNDQPPTYEELFHRK